MGSAKTEIVPPPPAAEIAAFSTAVTRHCWTGSPNGVMMRTVSPTSTPAWSAVRSSKATSPGPAGAVPRSTVKGFTSGSVIQEAPRADGLPPPTGSPSGPMTTAPCTPT